MIKTILSANENISPNDKEISILKEHFPSCFKPDGSFDMIQFSEFLKDKIDITHEGYELKFLGKNYARLLSSLETETVIVPDETHNSLPENYTSQNIYISGDNLDGLKHLLKSYAGKIKCIYIDPPYNTGSDGFVYNDKFNFSINDLIQRLSIDEEQAQHILDLTTRGSASHSAWLMFMYPRLQLARDLLTNDGIIFISIDDNEHSNCKLICDDIFGEENFLTCISRATGTPTGGGFDGLVNELDYVLIYAHNISTASINSLGRLEKDEEIYNEIDEHGNRYLTRSLRRTGGDNRREDRPTMYFPMIDPDGNEVFPIGPSGYESRWICNRETAAQLEANGMIVWKKRKLLGKEVWHPYQKHYLNGKNKKPGNIWKYFFCPDNNQVFLWDEIEGNKKATRDIRNIFDGKKIFDTAKPIELIEKIISIGSNPKDIVLDFFSGSATTAHSLMNINCQSLESERKYILIQNPEQVKKNSDAEKAGFKTIDTIGQERIIRAAKKLKEAFPDTSADLGFKHYTLKDVSKNTLDKLESFDNSGFVITDTSIYDEFGTATILTTWLIHDGYGFINNAKMLTLADYTAYWCDNHLYCIHPNISEEAIKALIDKYKTQGSFNPQNIVIFGYNFSYVELENIKTNIKILRDSEKNLKINLDIRY